MTLGLTSSGAVKIKTDGEAGLRAVECACCNPGPCGGGCKTLANGFDFPTAVSVSVAYTPPDLSWIMAYPEVCYGSSVAENQGCAIANSFGTDCGDASFDVIVSKDENGNCYLSLSVWLNTWPGSFSASGIIDGLGTFTLSGTWLINTFCADCENPYYTEPGSVTIGLG
jgi:hypothetical protein